MFLSFGDTLSRLHFVDEMLTVTVRRTKVYVFSWNCCMKHVRQGLTLLNCCTYLVDFLC